MFINILDRYLVSKVVSKVIFALLGLILFSLIIRITDQLSIVGHGGYSVWKAIIYSSIFAIPDINTFFPTAGLLGAVIALGILASHRELIIIQAAGVSKFRILIGLLWFIIPAGLINLAIQQWVSPVLTNYAINLKASALTGQQNLFSQNQTIWAKSNHQFINISMSQENQLNDVFIIDFSPTQVNTMNTNASNDSTNNNSSDSNYISSSLYPSQTIKSIIQGQDATWDNQHRQWIIKQAVVYTYGNSDLAIKDLATNNNANNANHDINHNADTNVNSNSNNKTTDSITQQQALKQTLLNLQKLGQHTARLTPLIQQAVSQNQHFTLRLYQNYHWASALTPRKLSLVNQHTENLSLSTLWNYIKFLKNTEQNANQYLYIFWSKIFSIISFFVMIFIATATIFGNMRNRSMLLKVFYAVIVGLIFHLLNNIIGPTLVTMGINPILAALSASILFSLYGMFLYLKRN